MKALLAGAALFALLVSTSGARASLSIESESTYSVPALNVPLSIYSEVLVDARNQNQVPYIKMTSPIYKPHENIEGYFGISASFDTRSTANEIYNDNYFAPLAGLQYQLGTTPFQAFVEYRYVVSQHEKPSVDQQTGDFRSGLTGYGLQTFSANKLFNEFYTEAVYSSRQESNIFLTAFNKFGVQRELNNGLTPQVYVEGFGKRDRLGYFYENLQELRFGSRLRYQVQSMSFAVSAHRAVGTYTEREYRDPNPYGPAYSKWEGLFVFGGDF